MRTSMSTARGRRLARLALIVAAMLVSALRAFPLLGLVGSLAGLVNAPRGSRRRAAKAAVWGSLAAVAWIVLVDGLHEPSFGYAAPAVAAAVVFTIHRPRLRGAAARAPRRQRSV
jgi:hypothetical protein